MNYDLELRTVQTWLKQTVGLNSWRRAGALPKLARPVLIWESPYRSRKRNLSRYVYTQNVKLYGKLFVNTVEESLHLQNQLIDDLEDRVGTFPIKTDAGEFLGYIKAAEIEFKEAEGLDIPFTFAYEVTYSRTRPAIVPPPGYVITKVHSDFDD